jgi:hypothetical protein
MEMGKKNFGLFGPKHVLKVYFGQPKALPPSAADEKMQHF